MKRTLIVLMLVLLSAVLMVSCNVSLEVYTVTFDTQGGSEIDPVEVKEWRKVTKPADPTREGFNFVKWTTDEAGETEYDFDSFVRDNITLYAQWTDKVCKVTFNSMEGSAVDPVEVKYGETVTKPTDPTREGYNFSKWTTDEAGEEVYNFDSAVKEDITLYAKWLKVCTVTFDSNGGSAVAEQKVNDGETVDKPSNPKKSGYAFDKWTTDEAGKEEYSFNNPVTKDITLFAQWRSYQVGETGPAGGIIFYVNTDTSKDWTYLEYGKSVLAACTWGPSGSDALGTETGIGAGLENTKKLAEKGSSYVAAYAVYGKDLYNNGYTDWFIPSKEELNLIQTNIASKAQDGFIIGVCWSSSEVANTNKVYAQDVAKGFGKEYNYERNYTVSNGCKIQPVRRF